MKDDISKELDTLIKQGHEIYMDFANEVHSKENKGLMGLKYESWYTVALRLVEQLLPARLEDFASHYSVKQVRKSIDYANYGISDYLQGTRVTFAGEERFSGAARAFSRFQIQLQIVISLKDSLASKLINLEAALVGAIYDDELEKARKLAKHKLLREAGVVTGVVLEDHLQKIAAAHQIKIAKKNPDISTLNDLFKDREVYGTSTWRFIQHLGDLRNLCDHKKEHDPTAQEVEDLVNGVDKILKTVN